jgi:hypothetical protein
MRGDDHAGLCGLELGNGKITSVWDVMHAQVHPEYATHLVSKEPTFSRHVLTYPPDQDSLHRKSR